MATNFGKISTLYLSYAVTVKSTLEISQNFVALSEYMIFNVAFITTRTVKKLRKYLVENAGTRSYIHAPAFSMRYFLNLFIILITDYGHPERAFFQKFETFGLGQTNGAEFF